ncbi:MAG: LOG family protein [Coprococcus sp.]
MITTETMRERKQIMEDKADAFIVTPGGINSRGIFEILTLKQTLGRHGKAIVIFNQNGFYDHLLSMLKETSDKGFMTPATNEIYTVMDNSDEILDYLESYKTDIGRVFKF